MVENCRRQYCQLRMRNTYFVRHANIDASIKRLRNFCINENKMVINREYRMLIKVLHQDKWLRFKEVTS